MSGETGGPTGRILVVDDEESLRVTLGAFLREEGNEVTVVADYDEAAAALEATDFDLVLSDIVLPGKSGIEVLTSVRKKDSGCPVVMLTGEPTLKTAAEAVRLGAFDYLAKPIRRAGVVRVARQALTHRVIVLENRRLERENREHQERLEERVAEQTREISAIAEIGRIIGSSLDIEEVYEEFTKRVRRLIPADLLTVYVADERDGGLVAECVAGDESAGVARGDRLLMGQVAAADLFPHGRGRVIDWETIAGIAEQAGVPGERLHAGFRSIMAVPLTSGDEMIGVLCLRSAEAGAYSEQHLSLADRVADQIAGAIANARLHGALETEAEQRRLSESRYRGFVEALPDMLFRVSSDGTFLDFSPGRGVQPIAEPESFLNRKIEDVLPRKVARLLMEGIRLAIDRRAPVEREYQLSVGGERFDYEARLVAIGEDEVVAVIRDITERGRSRRDLERLATTDALTGLLNRRRLRVILDEAVRSAVRRGGQGAVIYLDLDGLKLVNDTHGHAAGDRVLRAVGEALRKGLRATDAVARTGGDEFMVVLPDADPEAALERANQLARRVSDIRLREGGEAVGATCSAGVVTFPAEGASTDDLIVFADVAMYRAKESGGNRAALYDPTRGGREALTAMQRTRSMIMAALDHDRVRLVRQPVVGVRGGRPTMYEALARLEDEDGTIRMPVEFIPQAETLGLVERIDRRVVEGACERWRRYADAGEEMLLSVNMSPRSFGDEMLQFIDEQAEKWRVDRPALTVEITETAVARRAAQTEAFVRGLRERGFRVAMDDFGTGSTSFALMRELQLDYVKLDGSLIRNLAADAPGRDFVRAIAEVAHATGAEVVAEHVQDDETMAFLAECRVEYAQGYHLGRPEEFPLEPSGDSGE